MFTAFVHHPRNRPDPALSTPMPPHCAHHQHAHYAHQHVHHQHSHNHQIQHHNRLRSVSMPSSGMVMYYPPGGNIAYPAAPASTVVQHPLNYQHRSNCITAQCRGHQPQRMPLCYCCLCVERRAALAAAKEEEEKKKGQEEAEKAKYCSCPHCTTCAKAKKKAADEKWWSLAVPGEEGVVVGMVCTIL